MKATKTRFTDLVEKSVKVLDDNVGLGIGDYIYEVTVVRKFRAKFDSDDNLIIPKGVK